MTAVAQGSASVALVMGLMLLQTRHSGAAIILLAVQSGAVAISAITLHHPVMTMPPLLLAAGAWVAFRTDSWPRQVAQFSGNPASGISKTDRELSASNRATASVGNATFGIVAASILIILCQSQGVLALPLAVVLLGVLSAAIRQERLSHVLAMVATSNGLTLAASLIFGDNMDTPVLLPLSCLLLPLPLAARLTMASLTRHKTAVANWISWLDVAVSLLIFAATFLIPLDPLASVFGPLLGLDGILRSCRRRKRPAMSLEARSLALLGSIFSVLAVCVFSPIGAWLAVLAAIMTYLRPGLVRYWDEAVAAFFGAGIVLFGLMLLATMPLVLGYFSVFVGSVMIAAAVPDLAVVTVIAILRLANEAAWPLLAEIIGTGISLLAVLTCALRLLITSGRASLSTVWCSPITLLQSSQAAIAALAICMGTSDGRFAALVLLALSILMRTAARDTDRTVFILARVGLGGVPLGGVFPGLVLVVLAATEHDPWLLLPLGAAALPILAASLPDRLPKLTPAVALPSFGWLPLVLALLVGYFAPEGLVRLCHTVTAGH